MAVQFADNALDGWLTRKIAEAPKIESQYDMGCLDTLKAVQKQLHAFWGSALKVKD